MTPGVHDRIIMLIAQWVYEDLVSPAPFTLKEVLKALRTDKIFYHIVQQRASRMVQVIEKGE